MSAGSKVCGVWLVNAGCQVCGWCAHALRCVAVWLVSLGCQVCGVWLVSVGCEVCGW